MAETRSWLIPVCNTCDKLAVWPFCEHRPGEDTGASAEEWRTWYSTIRVSTRAKKKSSRG